ncbi:MAG: hypothetical protein Ta2B_29100 [Termitinemataceae bacterium]|nr:MAG: hypothetical protein Ta2B_29100 [Termitinemataceae bacterium]
MPSRTLALSHKSQVNISCPTELRMFLLCICALAAVIQSSLTDGGASLIVALSALFAALLTESLISIKSGRLTILDGSAAVSAFVLTLLLPNTVTPVAAVLGVMFAVTVTKMSYGGLGASWLNPALSGILFLRFCWPSLFNDALSTSPLMVLSAGINSGGLLDAPMDFLRQNGFNTIHGNITSFINEYILSIFKVEYPAFYLDFYNAQFNGIIADRGVYALLICSIVLLVFGVSRYLYSAVYLALYLFMIEVFGGLPFSGKLLDGDMIFGLLTGGTVVAAFFLLSEPSTSPKTSAGKYIIAILAALLSFFFRYVKNEQLGAIFAIAVINLLVPLIRSIESAHFFKKDNTRCLNS